MIDPKIAEHRGRLVKTTGDGLLVEFVSVVDALRCAGESPADHRIEFRIGIHQGDVVAEDGDIFGDGVNVAARLEGLAEPGGICVSARVQEDAAGKLGNQALKNITRPVRAYRVRTEPPLPSPSPQAGEGSARSARVGAAELPLPDKPSIAVLPFANMSGDPEQEYFVDGMVEEIITALSRIRWLFVLARNSSFSYKGQSPDMKQVGRELGVRYVLEGSVRKAGGRVRITAQLIDAASGAHLWADRFDGSLKDVFDLQHKVASSVAGVIEPALQAAEAARSAGRPTSDLTAYDLYLRAYAVGLSSGAQIPEALDFLEQAIERDPDYGPALALAALFLTRMIGHGRSADPQAGSRRSANFARQALQVADDHPGTVVNAAVSLVSRRRHRRNDGTGRPGFGPQPEFRAGVVPQRLARALGRAIGSRDRACRGRAASQPARPHRVAIRDHRRCALRRQAFR